MEAQIFFDLLRHQQNTRIKNQMLIYPELKPLLFQLYPATTPKQKLIPDNLSYQYINGSVYKDMGNYFGWGKYSMVMGDRVMFKVIPPLLDQV